jgi:hypothetical protein
LPGTPLALGTRAGWVPETQAGRKTQQVEIAKVAIDAGKISKNQTAAQRAAAAEIASGKVCSSCGEAIKLKDLLNVKQVDHSTGRKVSLSYHRRCYGL